MKDKLKGILIAGAAIAVLAAGGAAIAGATGGGDDDGTDQAIPQGSALDKASAVALKATGGDKVSATEIRDEEGYYEIEVQGKGDVHLDRNFNVIDKSTDSGGGEGD
jgi:uncharacterized membrane protein YkoI